MQALLENKHMGEDNEQLISKEGGLDDSHAHLKDSTIDSILYPCGKTTNYFELLEDRHKPKTVNLQSDTSNIYRFFS